MKKSKKTIDVVYASDDGYWRYMATSMLSAMKTAASDDALRFWILDNGLSDGTRASLESLCRAHGCPVSFCAIDFEKFKSLPKVGPHISNTSYARWDMAALLPESVDKAIYLDCDTIVKGSLAPLYHYDLSGYSVGGVTDIGYYCAREQGVKGFDLTGFYINAGVLLVNLPFWREKKMGDRLLNWTIANRDSIQIGDQDVINSVCQGNILKVDYRFNVQDSFPRFNPNDWPNMAEGNAVKAAVVRPVVIHYTFTNKPWNNLSIKWAKDWLMVYRELPSSCQDEKLNAELSAMLTQPFSVRLSRTLSVMRYLTTMILLPWRWRRYAEKIRREMDFCEIVRSCGERP